MPQSSPKMKTMLGRSAAAAGLEKSPVSASAHISPLSHSFDRILKSPRFERTATWLYDAPGKAFIDRAERNCRRLSGRVKLRRVYDTLLATHSHSLPLACYDNILLPRHRRFGPCAVDRPFDQCSDAQAERRRVFV